MSQENVEIVRSIYASFERGDVSAADWAHPDIEYVIADGPSPSTSKGLAAMAETHGSFMSAWQDWRAIGEEYRDLGEGRVLVLYRSGGRGKHSGLDLGEIGTQGASLFELVDGKVTRLVQFLDRADALEAAGLRE